ncbi:PQQ-dependent dehydrogenase, methanol/ethanol family [Inquilinus limosus]|uniref:PQQ-dependent dehydrogenase, methanol/ethanol family n=1 Tax=Inquilinus limosus TaxID=171674 RepID=UPI003F179E88
MLPLASLGCSADRPPLPVTQESRPLQADNARLRGTAPPVVEITGARLVRARSEPQNWLTYYGAYDGQRYSALDRINTGNVASLKAAWAFQYTPIGLIAGPANFAFEATPIVVDGVMFLTGPDAHVWALDAATGAMLWHYHHAIPIDVPLCCGNVNRGVAVAAGKVFFVTPTGRLVALDAVTGSPVWERMFADPRAGESATVAPLVVKDKVLVGSSGGEYGVRGHIDAFDLETGRPAWRRYTVPKPGEPGAETWEGDSWQRGGGPAWITGSYDPELDLVYWSTGNPGPVFEGSGRAGANLYTDTILALDPETGAIRWHYQMTPHDVWDYDGVSENILFERNGRRLLAHFDKNGYLFVLDRTNGRLVHATPFVRTTWGEIPPQTGAVTVRRVPTAAGTEICPGPAGGKEWNHASYSQKTGLLYAPVIEMCAMFQAQEAEFRESLPYWGGGAKPSRSRREGFVKAFDPLTGREAWAWRTEHPVVSSLLTTAGGLVFVGKATGEFMALDARNGRPLWEFQTGSGIHGSPVTYSVAGKQYVAVPSGWGGWVEGFAPELYGAPRGNALFVFTLP